MNLLRISRLSRILPVFAFSLITSHIALAATEDAAQRQLREDRERFQREVDRQTAEAKIRADQARLAAEQQRTTDELERLRAQQSRQSAGIRSLTETTRTLTTAPILVPSSRIATQSSTATTLTTSSATIIPDFSISVLSDGNCILYIKGRPPEVKSSAEVQAALQQFLAPEKPARPAL